MEHSKDPISVRIARVNSEIVGKTSKLDEDSLLARESLLDTLQALYEECSLDNLKNHDPNIAVFVEKYKDEVKEIKQLRVNVSDFEIKNVIGRGHFGEVHLVKEKQTGDLYAMKTIRKFDKDISKMSFDEERNIMVYSNSHWLTSLQYAFQDSTYLFFIMDYQPGGDLLGLLSRQGGSLPESAATFFVAELVLALEDLHKMGYIHRDIKPDNILLDRYGHIKLADFGSSAKLNNNGVVTGGPPVGTPDYVAPEVLQCLDNRNDVQSESTAGYGVSCDFWSLGILAYELIIGRAPFTGKNSTSIYAKIMNHQNNLRFPPDATLSQAYVDFIKSLVTEVKSRLNLKQIKSHDLFKDIQFDSLREQVPPYVPKISSLEDTSNFSDIPARKNNATIDNFKKRSQFSGRNLPFVGFTFTPNLNCYDDNFERRYLVKDEIVQELKAEVQSLRQKIVKSEEFSHEKNSLGKKLEEKSRKLENLENLRDKLERDLANAIAESMALKRTVELERKDRAELEKKALNLIKGAKLKWEIAEKSKVEALTLEIEQQKEKISQLTNTNHMLNEQLQHALKLEDKHKESLERVQVLNRRSVIGLESRLDKVTNETHSALADLQKKLSEEVNQKAALEHQLCKLQNREASLITKLQESEKNFETWKVQLDEAEKVIRCLNDQVSELEKDVEKVSEYKEEIANLHEVLENNQKILKELENRNTLLQLETKAMDACKKELEEMQMTISKLQNDKKVSDLESQLLEEREKTAALRKQLQDSENISSENQELRELRTKFWRTEKELNNCKIDKRILERELKDAGAEMKQLKDIVRNFDKKIEESKKIHESVLLELNSINETITLEHLKLKENHKSLQDKLNEEKQKSGADKILVNELKNIINAKDGQINSLNMELNSGQQARLVLENEIKELNLEKSKILDTLGILQKEKTELYDELHKAMRQVENTNLNLNALREACTLLENQVVEYEKLNSSYESKCAQLNDNTEKLIQDLCRAKQDIQESKKQTNEEKSLKLQAQVKAKRLEEEIECLQNESKSYKEQCIEYKQYSSELSDELSLAEEKISNLEVTLKSYERQIDDLRTESRIVKQENTDYLTQMNKLKELNYKLKNQVKELLNEKNMLFQKLRELEIILNEKTNYYKEREVKWEATIKQQIKLIDYLQSKVDDQSNKKRTLTEVLFGNSKKENHPPKSLAMNYKELEVQLLKERQENKCLNEEIYKLKAATAIQTNSVTAEKLQVERHKSEIISPRSKFAMQQLVNSPSKQKSELFRQPSQQRMHHNIPHRFESRLCTKTSTKCAACSEFVSLGRSINVCSECNLVAHGNCVNAIPNTCGLPQMFAKHYKDSMEPRKNNVQVNLMDGKKRYACLTNSVINIYTEPPKEQKSTLLQTFPLKPTNSHGKVILEPLPSEIGIPVANSDLAFILKVEVAPDTTCWPPKCLIFMTLSAPDKDKWFSALQKLYCDDSKPKYDHIVKIPEDLKVNVFVDLTDNIKVLGTSKGLYSFYEKNLLHIDGPTEVHQISIMKSTNMVLMIVSERRELIFCDLNHLINLAQCAQCTKPKLKFTNLLTSKYVGFHTLEASQFSKQQKICAATSRQLLILDYNLENNSFVPVRMLDTAEPTSCMLFTENSLIVGTDKFFEIDLMTFETEEFLDVSDTKLKGAEACYKMGSFPLAIIEVSSNPKEYILCFNEFSVFVDEYGRSTRKTGIKSTHLPVGFHFSKPFLYIVQFAAVEILKITEDTCNASSNDSFSNIDTVRLELEKFQYIGSNKRGIYICLSNEIKFIDAVKNLDDECSSIVSETTEQESDRFSFSSSMVQSLDGNLSDSEGAQEINKKVRFSQTDL